MTFDIAPFRSIYPWESHWLPLESGRMHYLDEGQGDPLVLLHGNPTWSFYWRSLVQALAPTHRLIVPDHMGMGLSDKPDARKYGYTLRQRVDDLDALLENLNVTQNLTLVVHDWGGMIGLAYAVRHPGRVKRLVVLNTAGFGLPQGRNLPWQLAMIRHLPTGFLVKGLNAFSRGALLSCSTRPGKLTPLIRQAYLAPYDSWAHRIAVHRFVLDIPLKQGDPSFDMVEEVSRKLEAFAALPLLILWGEQDFVFDRHFLAEWRRRLPHAEVHTFADAGHYVMEDAAEEIIPLVRAFLEKHPLA